MIERILCALLGHRYVTQRVFSPHSRQIGCTRCCKEWGMHDPTRSLVPWDGEFESMYRLFGQWPRQLETTNTQPQSPTTTSSGARDTAVIKQEQEKS